MRTATKLCQNEAGLAWTITKQAVVIDHLISCLVIILLLPTTTNRTKRSSGSKLGSSCRSSSLAALLPAAALPAATTTAPSSLAALPLDPFGGALDDARYRCLASSSLPTLLLFFTRLFRSPGTNLGNFVMHAAVAMRRSGRGHTKEQWIVFQRIQFHGFDLVAWGGLAEANKKKCQRCVVKSGVGACLPAHQGKRRRRRPTRKSPIANHHQVKPQKR